MLRATKSYILCIVILVWANHLSHLLSLVRKKCRHCKFQQTTVYSEQHNERRLEQVTQAVLTHHTRLFFPEYIMSHDALSLFDVTLCQLTLRTFLFEPILSSPGPFP